MVSSSNVGTFSMGSLSTWERELLPLRNLFGHCCLHRYFSTRNGREIEIIESTLLYFWKIKHPICNHFILFEAYLYRVIIQNKNMIYNKKSNCNIQ